MFRFFLRLNIFGRLISQALLILYLIILVLPLLIGFGLIGDSGVSGGVAQASLMQIISAKGLQAFFKAAAYSFGLALLCSIYGAVSGFYTARYFTGKFLLFLPATFLLVSPEFLSFLLSIPIVGAVSGSRNLSALTYGGTLSWGLAITLFCSHAFFLRVPISESRSATMLGAGTMEIILYYLLPRAKKLILFSTLFLTCQFLSQGLFTARYAFRASDTFFFYLFTPGDVYGIHGPGAIAYGFLLIAGLIGALAAHTYFRLEFSTAGAVSPAAETVHKHKKKVTRKKKKKRRKKAVKKEIVKLEEPEPIVMEEQEEEIPPLIPPGDDSQDKAESTSEEEEPS